VRDQTPERVSPLRLCPGREEARRSRLLINAAIHDTSFVRLHSHFQSDADVSFRHSECSYLGRAREAVQIDEARAAVIARLLDVAESALQYSSPNIVMSRIAGSGH
jgi:hypothetical protein